MSQSAAPGSKNYLEPSFINNNLSKTFGGIDPKLIISALQEKQKLTNEGIYDDQEPMAA